MRADVRKVECRVAAPCRIRHRRSTFRTGHMRHRGRSPPAALPTVRAATASDRLRRCARWLAAARDCRRGDCRLRPLTLGGPACSRAVDRCTAAGPRLAAACCRLAGPWCCRDRRRPCVAVRCGVAARRRDRPRPHWRLCRDARDDNAGAGRTHTRRRRNGDAVAARLPTGAYHSARRVTPAPGDDQSSREYDEPPLPTRDDQIADLHSHLDQPRAGSLCRALEAAWTAGCVRRARRIGQDDPAKAVQDLAEGGRATRSSPPSGIRRI